MPATAKPAGAKRRAQKQHSYAAFIAKISKRVHPDLGLSSKSLVHIDALLNKVMDDLIQNAAAVAKSAKKSTLSARHVQGATRIALPFELAKHAVSEGTRAVTAFTAA